MAQRVGNTYKCLFCSYTDPNPSLVNDHQHQNHEFVLLPITKQELAKLMMFFFTKDEALISEDLYKRIRSYSTYKIQSPPTD